MRKITWLRHPPPGVDLETTDGALIVIEGPDSSGRSTQINLLTEWLEKKGFSVAQVGLRRSQLVAKSLEKAKKGNILSPQTMSLFYATDFYDQLENTIIPALKAGSIVLADRYIFTLIVRDIVRGAERDWVESLYSMAIQPDAVYFLKASTRTLTHRTLESYSKLDYWESGMDLGISRDWYESFVKYQKRISVEFENLIKRFGFEIINANRSVISIHRELKGKIENVLDALFSRR